MSPTIGNAGLQRLDVSVKHSYANSYKILNLFLQNVIVYTHITMQKTPFYPEALYFDTRVRSYLEHKLARTLPEPNSPEFEGFIKNLQLNEPELFSEVKRILWDSSAQGNAKHKSYLVKIKHQLSYFSQRVNQTIKAKHHLIIYLFGGLTFLIPVLYLFSQALYLNEAVYTPTPVAEGNLEITPGEITPGVETSIPEPRVMVQVSQVLPLESIAVPTPQVSAQAIQGSLAAQPDAVANPLSTPVKIASDSPVSSSAVPASVGEVVSETPRVETVSPIVSAIAPMPVSMPVASTAPVVQQTATPIATPADVAARPTALTLHTVENMPPTTLNIAQGERPKSLTLVGRESSP